MSLPNGFTAINTVRASDHSASFIGVVISLKQPFKSRGTDWVLDFQIQDDFTSGQIGNSTMSCRIFKPEHKLPRNIQIGDLVILRNFKLSSWKDRIDCHSSAKTSSGFLIFPGKRIPIPELSQEYQLGSRDLTYEASYGCKDPTIQEQMAIIHLKAAASVASTQIREYAADRGFKFPPPNKLALIKDLDYNKFYDIRAEVVNLYYPDYSTAELKITDYTSNTDLFLYMNPEEADEFGTAANKNWTGPYGQLTLSVRLYGINSAWARNNVQKGDFVLLRNVRTKLSPANKLEGALHEDRENPSQVDIRKLLSQTDIEEIKKRKDAYEMQRTTKSIDQNVPKKSSAKASAKRKEEKKERQRLQKEQEKKELEKRAEEEAAAKSGINTYVRAGHPEHQLSTLSEIIHNPALNTKTSRGNTVLMPYVNSKYRTQVRVVAFHPPKLEEFTHSYSDSKWNSALEKNGKGIDCHKDRWEWGFVLLVEDAKAPTGVHSEKLRVILDNEAGQHLLKMNAVDLAKDQKALKKLEEKLFLLWGNLLELNREGFKLPLLTGDERLQNKPFECCLMEFGSEVPTNINPTGWQRTHKLFATTIMD